MINRVTAEAEVHYRRREQKERYIERGYGGLCMYGEKIISF
jgi:hypothetical protein